MDPLAGVDPDADTSFALMLGAQARGHAVLHIAPAAVGYASGRCVVGASDVNPTRGEGAPGSQGAVTARFADELDVVFIRTDPPFDSDYLHVTQLLQLAEARGTLVVNKPSGLQAANEHLWSLRFPELGPESLVSASEPELLAFMARVGGTMVLKPIDGHGGEGVLVVSERDRNRHAIVELLTHAGQAPVLAQAYLPAARQGDKRVLLLDGECLGSVNRVPSEDEHRGNLHVGATAQASTLTAQEQAVCDTIGPALAADGLWFVGVDLIGGKLTEVNVTSPTGIQEIEGFDGVDLCARVWQWCERQVERRRPGGR